MPAVAMKCTPATRHTAIVPATVVAPHMPEIVTAPRSRGPTLRTWGSTASRSICSLSIPT